MHLKQELYNKIVLQIIWVVVILVKTGKKLCAKISCSLYVS